MAKKQNGLQKFNAMLRGRGFKIGDQVVCTYRVPNRLQWWIHPFWIGVIEEPRTEPRAFGTLSEADYCAKYQCVPVRYLGSGEMAGFTQRDSLANLVGLIGKPVTESPWFGDGQQQELVMFGSRAGIDYRGCE